MESKTKNIKSGPFGVYYGWVIVSVAFLVGITQAGVFQNILSIFMIPMEAEFGWSRSFITGAIAVGSLAGGFAGPFLGPFMDRHGPRMMAFYGITILSCGLIALGWLSSLWQLYLFFGTGRMIAAGLLNLVVTVSVSNWFALHGYCGSSTKSSFSHMSTITTAMTTSANDLAIISMASNDKCLPSCITSVLKFDTSPPHH